MDSYQAVFSKCFEAKPWEKILVLFDEGTAEIGNNFYSAAKGLGLNVVIHEMPRLKVSGQEPLPEVAELMKKFDVELLITSESLTHTRARMEATGAGARIATMPGITEETARRCIDIDYTELLRLCNFFRQELNGRDKVHIATDKGTNLSFSIKNRQILEATGLVRKKGDYDNIPGAEVFTAPIEDSANGLLVVDGSMAGLGLTRDLGLKIKNGIIQEFSGDKSEKLKELMKTVNDRTIAEFGIGCNPKAIITGNVLEDEKALGTIHIAFGTNEGFGGRTKANVHLDGVIRKPSVAVDGRLIIRHGRPISI